MATSPHALPPAARAQLHSLISDIPLLQKDLSVVYQRLRAIEEEARRPPHNVDPADLRYFHLSRCFVKTLIPFFPDDVFDIASHQTAPKLRKICNLWDLDPKHLLFFIAFDYSKQGQTFFSALVKLAALNDDWELCLRLLNRFAQARHASGDYRTGISRNDVIRTIEACPGQPLRPSQHEGERQEGEQLQHKQQIRHARPRTRSPSLQPEQAGLGLDTSPGLEQPRSAATVGQRRSPSPLPPSPNPDPESQPSSPSPLDYEPANPDPESQPSSPSPLDYKSASDPFESDPVVPSNIDPSLPIRSTGQSADKADNGFRGQPEEDDQDGHIDDDGPGFFLHFGSPLLPPSSPSPAATTSSPIVGNPSPTPTSSYISKHSSSDPISSPSPTPTPSARPSHAHKDTSAQATMASQPAPKRPRLEDATAESGVGDNDLADMVQNAWIKGAWLNTAMGDICHLLAPTIFFIDSAETERMVDKKKEYKRRESMLVGLNSSERVLLPIHVCSNHWVLAVIRHIKRVATSIHLHDSLPSSIGVMQAARDAIGAFIRLFLPDTPPMDRLPISVSTPRQTNSDDCGVFVFVCGLFEAVQIPLGAELDAILWRYIMATCLGAKVVDWQMLIPLMTDYTTLEDQLTDLETPACQAEAAKNPFKRHGIRRKRLLGAIAEREQALQSRLDQDFALIDQWLSQIRPARCVLDVLTSTASRRVAQLRDELEDARALEARVDACNGTTTGRLTAAQLQVRYDKTAKTEDRLKTAAHGVGLLYSQLTKHFQDWTANVEGMTGEG